MKLHLFVLLFTITAGLTGLTACAAPVQTASLPQPAEDAAAPAELPTAAPTAQPAEVTQAPPVAPTETVASPVVQGPIHEADFAGLAYPQDKTDLETMVDSYLSAAVPMDGAPIVLIVPHADFADSGHTLAAAFKQLEDQQYDTVVLIGVDRQPPSPATLAVFARGGYRTPLGGVPVDEDFSQALLAVEPAFSSDPASFQQEDAIELPLPFLQRTCPACRIVPILVNGEGEAIVEQLSGALIKATKQSKSRILVVAVSNLSTHLKEEDALIVDNATLSAIETRNSQALIEAIEKTKKKHSPDLEQIVSGRTPLEAVIRYGNALGADQAAVLNYMNTASSTDGDPLHVSGYGSAMFWHYEAPELNATQRKQLLDLARTSIEIYMRTGQPSNIVLDDPIFKRKAGVFITINKDGELRGCIGHLWADSSILEGVQEMAVAAAIADPRFQRMTPGELSLSKIEISILSPVQRVRDIEEIEIGKHGLYIKYKGRQGVLLPQVAVQQEWSRPKFLDNLCAKSGLPTTCWQENPTLYSFTALVFAEE